MGPVPVIVAVAGDVAAEIAQEKPAIATAQPARFTHVDSSMVAESCVCTQTSLPCDPPVSDPPSIGPRVARWQTGAALGQ